MFDVLSLSTPISTAMAKERKAAKLRAPPVTTTGVHDVETELSREANLYNLSSGILPSLGARSTRRVKLRRFIVSPYARRYKYVR